MERFIPIAIVCWAVAIVVARLWVVRDHRNFPSGIELARMEHRPFVHVLRTQDELEEAVRSARESERRGTDGVRSRTDRYEALIAPAAITQIRTERGATQPH